LKAESNESIVAKEIDMSRVIKIGKHKLKTRNPIASSLRDPKFKQKIVKDKKFKKPKHKKDLLILEE